MTRLARGNIVTFVIVGAVMLLVVVGIVSVVKRALPGDKPEHPSTSEVTDGTIDVTQDEEALREALLSQVDDHNKQQADKSSKPDNTRDSTKDQPTDKPGSTDPGNLPATGPTDVALSALGATTLAATSVAYMRSRRLA